MTGAELAGQVTGTRITVTIRLPVELAAVAAVLAALGQYFPDATIDTDHPDGWRIVCGPT